MPTRKPKKLKLGSALARAAKGQRMMYDKRTWDDSHRVGGNRRGDGRIKRARAAVILGNTLTLGLWHIPAIGIGAIRNMHKRGRQRHRYNKRQAAEARFENTFGAMFRGQLTEIADDYGVGVDAVQQFKHQLKWRLNMKEKGAGWPYGNKPAFLEAYAAFESDLREDPGVERLFQEWAPDA